MGTWGPSSIPFMFMATAARFGVAMTSETTNIIEYFLFMTPRAFALESLAKNSLRSPQVRSIIACAGSIFCDLPGEPKRQRTCCFS